MGNPQLAQAPSSPVLEEHGLQTARVDSGAVQRGEEYMEKFQYYNKDILTTPSSVHQVMDYWKSQSYSALHHLQEQFENAVHEHQRVYVKSKLQLLLLRVVHRFRDIRNRRLGVTSKWNGVPRPGNVSFVTASGRGEAAFPVPTSPFQNLCWAVVAGLWIALSFVSELDVCTG